MAGSICEPAMFHIIRDLEEGFMDKVFLTETKEKLNDVADELYKGNVTEGIADMGAVLPNIASIAECIESEELQQKLLVEVLTPALEAMENNDGALLADIISYELVEFIESLE